MSRDAGRRKEENTHKCFRAEQTDGITFRMECRRVDIMRVERMDTRYSLEGVVVAVLSAVIWTTPIPRFALYEDKE